MSKKDAEFEGFLRGLETARKTALEVEKDGGCVSDELNRIIRQRRTTGVTLGMTRKELDAATLTMKCYCYNSVQAMAMLILYEQNQWGAKRLLRFQKEFNRHVDALMEGSIDWHDIVACLEAETGVKLNFPEDLMQQKILC